MFYWFRISLYQWWVTQKTLRRRFQCVFACHDIRTNLKYPNSSTITIFYNLPTRIRYLGEAMEIGSIVVVTWKNGKTLYRFSCNNVAGESNMDLFHGDADIYGHPPNSFSMRCNTKFLLSSSIALSLIHVAYRWRAFVIAFGSTVADPGDDDKSSTKQRSDVIETVHNLPSRIWTICSLTFISTDSSYPMSE